MKKTIFLIPMLILSTLPMFAGCTRNCTITVINNDPDMGEVSGGGVFKRGTQVAIRAIPYETYDFDKWDIDDNSSTRASYTFVVEKDMTIYANFEHSTYSIEVDKGQAYLDFCGEFDERVEYKYKWGEQVDLAIDCYSGYKVEKWIDKSNGEVLCENSDVLDITMPAKDLLVECTFTDYTLFFGSYPQDKVTDVDLLSSLKSTSQTANSYFEYNGNKYYCLDSDSYFTVSPIEWDIVEESDDYILLISKEVLYGYEFTENDGRSYDTSDVRTFLSETFYNDAFSEEEKSNIQHRKIYTNLTDTINEYVFLPYYCINDEFFYDNQVSFKQCNASDFALSLGVTLDSYYYSQFLFHYFYENGVTDPIFYEDWRYEGCGYANNVYSGKIYGLRPMIQINK